ncbi:unnamed protein product [Paramecium pentaurelia]|uniref:PB1 domain-containing protein n=1 Tax=Paramecium pentaurelia TaxID=43138 RepID=A0A8S1UL79_9CILI|nr:unnamed protein product [Paramecium pentaurelia]
MNILVKYNEYYKILENIQTYKDLRKQIIQSFKLILKNNFTIYYFDEDYDKITISNQIDLDIIQSTENLQIIVQEIDNVQELTENSFQKPDKIVKETVNYSRKFSNDHKNNDYNCTKKQEQQEVEKKTKKGQTANNEQNNFEKQRLKIIKELNSTINHLRSEILKIESDDTEKRINEKIQNLQKIQINQSSLAKELCELPIIQQIEQAENNIINLNKVERDELRKNQNKLIKQIEKIISNRLQKQIGYVKQNQEVFKTEKKLQQKLIKTQNKNEKQLIKYNQLLIYYQNKLKEVENQQWNFEKIDYLKIEQLEKYLDKQMKEELKAKKQKRIENEKLNQKLFNLENIKNEYESDNFNNSFEID